MSSTAFEQLRQHLGDVLPPERPHVADVGHFQLREVHARRSQPVLEQPVLTDQTVGRPLHQGAEAAGGGFVYADQFVNDFAIGPDYDQFGVLYNNQLGIVNPIGGWGAGAGFMPQGRYTDTYQLNENASLMIGNPGAVGYDSIRQQILVPN